MRFAWATVVCFKTTQENSSHELSNRYTRDKANRPFRIAWIATDTSLSFNALASGAADLSITYHAYAEEIALRQGIADRCVYAWRDHFMLVGTHDPALSLPVSDIARELVNVIKENAEPSL